MIGKVGIVGGGLFGASCALELDSFHVALFEQSKELLTKASYANQNRHHHGYHYPRSEVTAKGCRDSEYDFLQLYGESLVSFDNYYCISKYGSKTSAADYLEFCRKMSLPFEIAYPPKEFLDGSTIDVCLKVPEPIFDYYELKRLVASYLQERSNIEIRLRHRVIGCYLNSGGSKTLLVESSEGVESYTYDFIINATYSNLNQICEWLGFQPIELQFEVCEVPIVEIPIKQKIGVTVMDGLFGSILPFGRQNQYLVYHVEASIRERFVSRGPEPPLKEWRSNWPAIQDTVSQFIPIIKEAKHRESMYAVKIVDPKSEETDARVTQIIRHGEGVWSILSGKIVTCVETAKRLAELIEKEV